MANQFRNVAYLCTNTSTNVADAACFQLADAEQFFDIACIFAANMNGTDPNNATLSFNETVTTVLTTNIGQVRQLQENGIKVLLTVLNNHEPAGWSNFTIYEAAEAFALQCAEAVATYGLDGIDIDDEYSSGTPNDTSLIMATYALTLAMPGKIVSKALFADAEYFQSTWDGLTLAGNLTYGWEMSYFDTDYGARLDPYVGYGMAMGDLGLGVNAFNGTNGPEAGAYVAANGVGGIMVFDVSNTSTDFLDGVAQAMYGQPIVVPPNCLS